MPTWARIRNDGVVLHSHPTLQNSDGRWHGPWTNHGSTSSRDRLAHEREVANEPYWTGSVWVTDGMREAYRRAVAGEMIRYDRQTGTVTAPASQVNNRVHRFQSFQEQIAAVIRATANTPQIEVGVADEATRVRPFRLHRTTDGPGISPEAITDRRYGIEIECISPNIREFERLSELGGLRIINENGYSHTQRHLWKITTDSSIHYRGNMRGMETMEVVSPILRGAAGMEQLKIICDSLLAAKTVVNTSCGLHVHHDATGMSVKEYTRVIMNYAQAQLAIDKLVAPSRRSPMYTHYCKPWLYSEIEALTRAVTKYDVVAAAERYKVVNAHAWDAHNTLEFRQHGGTVDYNKISAWVKFGQRLIENTLEGKDISLTTEVRDLLAWLSLPTDVEEFFLGREKVLNVDVLVNEDVAMEGAVFA